MFNFILIAVAAFLLYKFATTDNFFMSQQTKNGIAIGFAVFLGLIVIGGMLTGGMRQY